MPFNSGPLLDINGILGLLTDLNNELNNNTIIYLVVDYENNLSANEEHISGKPFRRSLDQIQIYHETKNKHNGLFLRQAQS